MLVESSIRTCGTAITAIKILEPMPRASLEATLWVDNMTGTHTHRNSVTAARARTPAATHTFVKMAQCWSGWSRLCQPSSLLPSPAY